MLRDSSRFTLGNIRQANRIEQCRLAVVDVAHDRHHGRTNTSLRSGLFAGGSVNLFCRLLFERNHVRICAEEPRHLAGQFRIQSLIDRGKYALRQQTRDQILGADVQLLREILYADAFRDRDAARDRLRLIRHHHARWWRVALHRTFLHAARNIALTGTPRRPTRTAAGPGRARRRKSWTYS